MEMPFLKPVTVLKKLLAKRLTPTFIEKSKLGTLSRPSCGTLAPLLPETYIALLEVRVNSARYR